MEYSLNNFSLLSPENTEKNFVLNDAAVNDLSVDFLADKLTESNDEKRRLIKILRNVPTDQKIISYRQEIYNDLKNYPDVAEKLSEIFDKMQYYVQNDRSLDINQSTVWELVHHLRSLQNYVDSVSEIKTLLKDREFGSVGLKQLSLYIEKIYSDSGFAELSKDLEALGEGVDMIHSVSLGINLDQNLQPKKVGILSFNTYEFGERGLLERFFTAHRKKNPNDKELTPFTMVTQSDEFPTPIMNNLTGYAESMLTAVTRKLKKELAKYTDYSGKNLAKLGDELIFYIRFIALEKKMTENGMPCCIPSFSDKDTVIDKLYNIKLAMKNGDKSTENPIVCNDIHFDKDSTVIILTGPNRGGKTIITQAVGLAFLMFQHGVFVPCAGGKLRICDGIFTHFPADENQTVTLGRLGEEAERFSRIWENATSESIILLNESFSSTSHFESLYIAKDVVKSLCCLGARTFFNTHMHELAENTSEFLCENSICGAASAVMGKREGESAFKINFEKPNGKSYAQEIAAKYGVTFEQLSKKFN